VEELHKEGTVKGQSRARAPRSDNATRNVYSQLSGLEDVGFNDFIKDHFIPEGQGQVESGFASLPDNVALETEEQTLEREKNEPDVLEALGSVQVCRRNVCREGAERIYTIIYDIPSSPYCSEGMHTNIKVLLI